jgi:hypothetical protein
MSVPSDLPPLPRTRPRAVTRAMQLLWIAVALGAGATLATFTLSAPGSVAMLLLAVLRLLVVTMLISQIGVGRAWARILLLVLFGLGVAQLLADAIPLLGAAPLLFMLGMMQRALEGLAIYLIFTPPGDGWFKAKTL